MMRSCALSESSPAVRAWYGSTTTAREKLHAWFSSGSGPALLDMLLDRLLLATAAAAGEGTVCESPDENKALCDATILLPMVTASAAWAASENVICGGWRIDE